MIDQTTPTCVLCARTLTADGIGYLGDGRLACVVVQACVARRRATTEADEDRETPAQRRASLMSAMEGGYAAPEDLGPVDATDCDGFVGGNAWGPCAECGRRLEDHTA
jgi:hypothetical protein